MRSPGTGLMITGSDAELPVLQAKKKNTHFFTNIRYLTIQKAFIHSFLESGGSLVYHVHEVGIQTLTHFKHTLTS